MGKWREMTRDNASGKDWRDTASDFERGDRGMDKVGANKKDLAEEAFKSGRDESVENNTAEGCGWPKHGPGFPSMEWGEDEEQRRGDRDDYD